MNYEVMVPSSWRVTASDVTGSVDIQNIRNTVTSSVVNGNVLLLAPRTLSASVSASVGLGTVSVTNLPIVYTTNTRTSVVGIVGGGKGTVRLSSVNGVVQLIGL